MGEAENRQVVQRGFDAWAAGEGGVYDLMAPVPGPAGVRHALADGADRGERAAAFACYQYDGERFRLGAVNVLSVRDGRISWIAGFLDPHVHPHFPVSPEFPPPDR
jgi:ketosteroid isomerase-like protein